LAAASTLTPGGVHSNARLAESPFPLFFVAGRDAHLTDVDGNDLIDYVLGQGALLLGHSPAPVLAAVREQLDRGLLFAGQHDLELEAAERLHELIPCAEQVRFNVTGTEAVQAAVRIARAATGRTVVVRFQGHYDGWVDPVLFNTGPRGEAITSVPGQGPVAGMRPVAGSAGIPASAAEDLLVLPWDDQDALDIALADRGGSIAAVLMEPIMANTGVRLPSAGYLEHVRDACTRHGVVLIFDEVITGFRVHPGGAGALLGVVPDLAVFGKALGSGFPVACVAGRASLFAEVGTGRVVHAGTFNSHPIALAAAVATLRILGDPATAPYAHIARRGQRLWSGIDAAAAAAGLDLATEGLPAIFSMSVGPNIDEPARHEPEARARLRRLLDALIARGIRVSTRGTWYLSAAHTDADIERTLAAFADAAHHVVTAPAS